MTSRPATMYFTGLARAYAQHRPSYPCEAIDFIMQGRSGRIRAVDVGCGTGISTRLLAERGIIVVGVDPNPEMLDEARSATAPGPIEYTIGTADRLPLPDGSVDLVVSAQAFHWFEPEESLREFHRVTKPSPSSTLALMWNLRDDSDAVTAGYNEVVRIAQEDAAGRGLLVRTERADDVTHGGYFEHPRTKSFPNPQHLDLNALLGRIRSASYFPKSGLLRDELESRLRQLFARHQRHGVVTLLHRTEVTLANRTR